MRAMRQTTLLLLLAVALVVMLVSLGMAIFAYTDASWRTQLDREADLVNKIAAQIDERTASLRQTAGFLRQNLVVQSGLRDTDFQRASGQLWIATRDLGAVMSVTMDNPYIEAIAIVTPGGGRYMYTPNAYNAELVAWIDPQLLQEAMLSCPERVFTHVALTDRRGQEHAFFLYSLSITDTIYRSDLTSLGTLYLFLSDTTFSSIYDPDGRGWVSALDEAGRALPSPQSEPMAELLHSPRWMQLAQKNPAQWHSAQLAVGDYSLYCAKVPASAWTLLYLRPALRMGRQNLTTILAIVGVLLVGGLLLLFTLRLYSRQFLRPIAELAQAMERVGHEDFAVQMPARAAAGEIGAIINGFNRMVRALSDMFERTRREEQGRREAQLRALRYQINPHMLYNTLASIRMTAMLAGDTAVPNMLLALSRLLRSAFTNVDALVSVAVEMGNVRNYLAIQVERYQGVLVPQVDVSQEAEGYLMPNMLLQPLIENAIHHGLCERLNGRDDPQLFVRVFLSEEGLAAVVEDNGCGIPEDRLAGLLDGDPPADAVDSHIGLLVTHRRIVGEFGPPYGLRIESQNARFTRVTALLPKKAAEGA